MVKAIAVAFDPYNQLGDAGCDARIDAAKQAPQGRVIANNQHFRQACAYQHADLIGNPLKFPKVAAPADVRYIVFFGANAAAEVTDIVPQGARIDPPRSEWCMQRLVDGDFLNGIRVADRFKHLARPALQRMLDIS